MIKSLGFVFSAALGALFLHVPAPTPTAAGHGGLTLGRTITF